MKKSIIATSMAIALGVSGSIGAQEAPGADAFRSSPSYPRSDNSRIERKLDQILLQLSRIEDRLDDHGGDGPGSFVEVVSEVNTTCLDRLVEWNTSFSDRINFIETCREVRLEDLKQRRCEFDGRQENQACYNLVSNWDNNPNQRVQFTNACMTQVYLCPDRGRSRRDEDHYRRDPRSFEAAPEKK